MKRKLPEDKVTLEEITHWIFDQILSFSVDKTENEWGSIIFPITCKDENRTILCKKIKASLSENSMLKNWYLVEYNGKPCIVHRIWFNSHPNIFPWV